VEETTLINSVTRIMIAAAFADAGSWHAAGHRLRVSVNLSVRNLRDHMLVEVLEQNARRNELEPADIDLEITESAVMVDPDHCIRLISLLRDRGYGVPSTISATAISRSPICRSCSSRLSRLIRRL
jgi:EAL domain-containing protein (putative c-di-GMP-specific phosphodiesterase class I)